MYLSRFFSYSRIALEIEDFFSGFCSRLYIDKYVDTRNFTSDTNLIFENFFHERNRLMAKITKNKKFLKLVKEYIQIFSGCFEQFFDFPKIMLFAKLKSCSKGFEKIQTYSLSDSKNFTFLVISSVYLYFQIKKNPEYIRENFVIRAPFCKD